jgi:hypothetical protein
MSNQFETPRSANDNETIKKKILNGKIQMKTSHIKRKILYHAHNNRVAIGTTHMGDGEVSNVCGGPYIYPSTDLIDSSASQVHFFGPG